MPALSTPELHSRAIDTVARRGISYPLVPRGLTRRRSRAKPHYFSRIVAGVIGAHIVFWLIGLLP